MLWRRFDSKKTLDFDSIRLDVFGTGGNSGNEIKFKIKWDLSHTYNNQRVIFLAFFEAWSELG